MNINDAFIIKQREEIFESYRQKIQLRSEIKNKMHDLNDTMSKLVTSCENLDKDIENIKTLIEIMITEDCDPVTAKLRWSSPDEYRNYQEVKEPGNWMQSFGIKNFTTSTSMYPSTSYAGSITGISSISLHPWDKQHYMIQETTTFDQLFDSATEVETIVNDIDSTT